MKNYFLMEPHCNFIINFLMNLKLIIFSQRQFSFGKCDDLDWNALDWNHVL